MENTPPNIDVDDNDYNVAPIVDNTVITDMINSTIVDVEPLIHSDIKFELIDLPIVKTDNKPGNLVNLNIDNIKEKYNFKETNRFYLNDLNSVRGRGRHSNQNVREIFVCLSGKCNLELFNCYKKEYIYINQNQAIFIPNNIWIDFYNFKDCIILVLVENNEPLEKKSIYNLKDYLSYNKIDENSELYNVYFKDYLIIDHVITIFWKSRQRYIHTKNIFKYYKDLRNLLFYSHKIILNFTIVGSNNEESFELYKNILNCNDGIFNDVYLEYDQTKKFPNNLMKMLHDKWLFGINTSFAKKSDLIVLRGSNDIVEPKIYIQMKEQYEKNENKLYIASKTIPHLDLLNISLIIPTTFSDVDEINYLDCNKLYYFNNQYTNRYDKNTKHTIGTIGFIGAKPETWKTTINFLNSNKNAFNIANEIELEMFIRRNITNLITITSNTFFFNIKLNDELSSLSSLLDLLQIKNTISISDIENKDYAMSCRIKYMIEYFNSNNIEYRIELLEKIIAHDNTIINTKLFEKYIVQDCNHFKTEYLSIDVDKLYFTGVRFSLPKQNLGKHSSINVKY